MIWLNALKEHGIGYEDLQAWLTEQIRITNLGFMSTKNFEQTVEIKGRILALQDLLLQVTADEREEIATRERRSQ